MQTKTNTAENTALIKTNRFVIAIMSMLMCTDAFATTDIGATATSADCTEPTLGTYSGDANFDAKWTANTIPLRWYNNNTLMQNVNTESNTCNYDGALTIPTTPPSRTGYIFAGWKVRPTMDFSTLTSLLNGQKRWAKGLHQNADYCCYAAGTAGSTQASCASDSEFRELEKHEWKIQFSSGTMYGTGHCSAKSGSRSNDQWNTSASFATYDQLESAGEDNRIYCWCQATGWKPSTNNPENTIYGQSSDSASSAWVFYSGGGSAASCAQYCAGNCSCNALRYSAFRRALAEGAGN